jgi:hypothetical protein
MAAAELWQQRRQRLPSGLSHHIADHQ